MKAGGVKGQSQESGQGTVKYQFSDGGVSTNTHVDGLTHPFQGSIERGTMLYFTVTETKVTVKLLCLLYSLRALSCTRFGPCYPSLQSCPMG